jgi:hypothetical protein
MKPDDFEQQLERQAFRQVPPEWRAEILKAAKGELRSSECRPTTIRQVLDVLLWPSPKAWAGLAAVWAVVLSLGIANRRQPEPRAGQEAAPSPATILALREQRRTLAQLIESIEPQPAEPPKTFVPRPRSEVCATPLI